MMCGTHRHVCVHVLAIGLVDKFSIDPNFSLFCCFCFFCVDTSPLSHVRFTFVSFRCSSDFFCHFLRVFRQLPVGVSLLCSVFFLQSMCRYTLADTCVCVNNVVSCFWAAAHCWLVCASFHHYAWERYVATFSVFIFNCNCCKNGEMYILLCQHTMAKRKSNESQKPNNIGRQSIEQSTGELLPHYRRLSRRHAQGCSMRATCVCM